MHMMTWQSATRKQMTWQRRRITGRHLAHRNRGVTAVQTQYKPDLLVEKGKKVGTGGQVNRVSPALDLLASHSIRWLYRTKMGPTQISCSDVFCPEPLLCNATGKM